MNSKKRAETPDVDRIGRNITRAFRLSDQEVEDVVSAPFLYARIRARIASEQEKRGDANKWWAALLTTWRPLAGMAAMAIIAAALFLFSAMAGTAGGGAANGEDDALATGEPGFERIVFTGEESLSNDEVLATIMNQDERDVRR